MNILSSSVREEKMYIYELFFHPHVFRNEQNRHLSDALFALEFNHVPHVVVFWSSSELCLFSRATRSAIKIMIIIILSWISALTMGEKNNNFFSRWLELI